LLIAKLSVRHPRFARLILAVRVLVYRVGMCALRGSVQGVKLALFVGIDDLRVALGVQDVGFREWLTREHEVYE